MIKVKYYARENKTLGTHSYYAMPLPNGTMSFDELCEDACRHTSIEVSLMKAAVTEYIRSVQRNVLLGFRVPIGEDFVTITPHLRASVADYWDEKGELVEATPDMLNPAKGKSTLTSSVSPKFCRRFADNVSWQKVNRRTGEVLDKEEQE